MQVHDFLIPGSKHARIEDEVVFVDSTLFPNIHLLLRRYRWGPQQEKGLAREVMLARIEYPASPDLARSSLKFVLTVKAMTSKSPGRHWKVVTLMT